MERIDSSEKGIVIQTEIKNFVKEFVENNRGRKTPFCMDEIERKFNIAREKKNKYPVCLTNMERLLIVSLLLRTKGIKRTYEPSRHGGFRELFEFKEIEEEVA